MIQYILTCDLINCKNTQKIDYGYNVEDDAVKRAISHHGWMQLG